MPWTSTGQPSLIQQHSSIWWINSPIMIPDDAQRKLCTAGVEHLPEQFVSVGGPAADGVGAVHAVGVDHEHVAQLAVADLLDQGLAVGRMAAHQPGGDLEVLLFGPLAGAEHPLQPARVGREPLLHEHVDALVDGVVEMDAAEAVVRGQHGDVAGPEAVDRLAIGVEADEAPLGRDVDRVAELLARESRARRSGGLRRRRPWPRA